MVSITQLGQLIYKKSTDSIKPGDTLLEILTERVKKKPQEKPSTMEKKIMAGHSL